MDGYDVAQICQNGHVINKRSKSEPDRNQQHCDKCGTSTITLCPKCQNPIRGASLVKSGFMSSIYSVPSFCDNCGSPFPWTESRLKAAHELAKEIDNINEEDRIILHSSIDDLVRDTPSSNVAVIRFKKIMQKVGPSFASMFREILVDVLSETIKKTLFPS